MFDRSFIDYQRSFSGLSLKTSHMRRDIRQSKFRLTAFCEVHTEHQTTRCLHPGSIFIHFFFILVPLPPLVGPHFIPFPSGSRARLYLSTTTRYLSQRRTHTHTHTSLSVVQEACDICSLSGGLLMSSTSSTSFLSTWEGGGEAV